VAHNGRRAAARSRKAAAHSSAEAGVGLTRACLDEKNCAMSGAIGSEAGEHCVVTAPYTAYGVATVGVY
jgi:hypothetical protein